MEEGLTPDGYGLDDPDMLLQATRVAPELFVALRLCKLWGDAHFPVSTCEELENMICSIATDGEETFSDCGISVPSAAVRTRFPPAFFPIRDRCDLLQKAYMSLVISHSEAAREGWEQVKRGEATMSDDHPHPEGAI